MGLAGRVADHRLAGRERSGHDGVLGRHHARLVEEDLGASEPVGSHRVAAVQLDLRAELGERVDVRIEAAPADDVTARRRHRRLAEAGQQWPCQQERRADARAEALVRARPRDVRRVYAHLVGRGPGDVGSEVGEQLHHRLDVADVRDVRQAHRLVAEQARGEDR